MLCLAHSSIHSLPSSIPFLPPKCAGTLCALCCVNDSLIESRGDKLTFAVAQERRLNREGGHSNRCLGLGGPSRDSQRASLKTFPRSRPSRLICLCRRKQATSSVRAVPHLRLLLPATCPRQPSVGQTHITLSYFLPHPATPPSRPTKNSHDSPPNTHHPLSATAPHCCTSSGQPVVR